MSAITVLNKANVPTGPFTREQVAEKLRTGEFSPDALAFVEGLSQWTPLREVLARIETIGAPVPPVGAPAHSYAPTTTSDSHVVYAGFWLRFVAIFVDGLILSPLTIGSFMLRSGMHGTNDHSTNLVLALVGFGYAFIAFVIRWLYFSLLEASPWQATVGKKVLGLKVTTLDGERIGFGRATGRYFGKIVSTVILMIGWIMAGFTERKQALHDMMAGTLVIRG